MNLIERIERIALASLESLRQMAGISAENLIERIESG